MATAVVDTQPSGLALGWLGQVCVNLSFVLCPPFSLGVVSKETGEPLSPPEFL